MTDWISFFVSGEPKAQPRPRARAIRKGKKVITMMYQPKGPDTAWKETVEAEASKHVPAEPLTGAVHVDVTFFLTRPLSHFRTGKYAHILKESAPKYPAKKPDRDNLLKLVEDALTNAGMWNDDCQTCDGMLRKRWAGNQRAGVDIHIRLMD